MAVFVFRAQIFQDHPFLFQHPPRTRWRLVPKGEESRYWRVLELEMYADSKCRTDLWCWNVYYPAPCMEAYIYPKHGPNVGEYSIHGAYGL